MSIYSNFYRFQNTETRAGSFYILILVRKFELRLGTDGSITPRAALVEACRAIVKDLSILANEFTKEYALRKMVSEGLNGSAQDGGH